MPRQILPMFVTSSDVDDLKKRLRASVKGTDQTVQTCAKLDDATRASWGQFYAAVLDYTAESTSFWSANAQNERGYAYEDELKAWQDKLKTGGCALTVPTYDPNQNKAQDAMVKLVSYLAIIAAAAGGAYVVSKVIEVIPRASQKVEVKTTARPPAAKERSRRRNKRRARQLSA